ncbi:hypothetical protein Tco_0934467 [Tanacetum coccineum]
MHDIGITSYNYLVDCVAPAGGQHLQIEEFWLPHIHVTFFSTFSLSESALAALVHDRGCSLCGRSTPHGGAKGPPPERIEAVVAEAAGGLLMRDLGFDREQAVRRALP